MQDLRIKKAQKFLNSAKTLLKNGDYDSCISRCYYALFHVSIVLLETLGVRQTKWEHRFVLSAFNKECVHRRKIFPHHFGQILEDIFYERMDADYRIEEKSFKTAKRLLDKAEKIFYSILKELTYEK